MKRPKQKKSINVDAYEDIIRIEKLDPYEKLISSFAKSKNKNN